MKKEIKREINSDDVNELLHKIDKITTGYEYGTALLALDKIKWEIMKQSEGCEWK